MNIYVVKDRNSIKIEAKDGTLIRAYEFDLMEKYMSCDQMLINFFTILYQYQFEGSKITFIDKTRGEKVK